VKSRPVTAPLNGDAARFGISVRTLRRRTAGYVVAVIRAIVLAVRVVDVELDEFTRLPLNVGLNSCVPRVSSSSRDGIV